MRKSVRTVKKNIFDEIYLENSLKNWVFFLHLDQGPYLHSPELMVFKRLTCSGFVLHWTNIFMLIYSVKSSELRYRYCRTSRQVLVPCSAIYRYILGLFLPCLPVYNGAHRRYINVNSEEICGLGISIIVLFQEFFCLCANLPLSQGWKICRTWLP